MNGNKAVEKDTKIAVVIPCYRVSSHILSVLQGIGPEVHRIYIVDDCCPEKSGDLVSREAGDPRIQVIYHGNNLGVGGAVLTGFQRAFKDGADVLVKIDGDGQMDPADLTRFVYPIIQGEADYTKGNRFFNLQDVQSMPIIRVIGNAGLSFMNKFSTGYWNIFDPTNGYLAIHAKVFACLPFDKIAKNYFFESDILFRLNIIRAVVEDIPMQAKYDNERSGISVGKEFVRFSFKHTANFFKRIFYNYYLRDFNIASIELVTGTALFLFGFVFGIYQWVMSTLTLTVASSGTVMLAALPILVGLQLILAFFNFDISSIPVRPLHKRL